MKYRTTVYLNKELNELAKKNKLNLSLILEDAINFNLSLSNEKKTLLEQKNKLTTELALVKAKLLEIEMEKKQELELQKRKEFIDDLTITRKNYFSEKAKNNSVFKKNVVDVFQEKHGLSREKVMALILSRY